MRTPLPEGTDLTSLDVREYTVLPYSNSTEVVPKLGHVNSVNEESRPRSKRWSAPSFVDYGPYGSFAPFYDSSTASDSELNLKELVYLSGFLAEQARKKTRVFSDLEPKEADETEESQDLFTQ